MLFLIILMICGVSSANENKILEEKVYLTVEFPITSNIDRDMEAKSVCEELAQNISNKREGTWIYELNAAIIDVDNERGKAKLSCSFELKRGESCNCAQEFCPDGGQVNGCSADCPDGYSASCDCGSCSGVKTSTCRCY